MKFSDYEDKTPKNSAGEAEKRKFDAKMRKALMSLVGKFEGKPQEDIIEEILSVAKKNKAEGKLTDADIDAFYSMLSPMLDTEKKKTLESVIQRIKTER